MPLSESAKDEIRSELAALHRLKVSLDERVKALEAVLAPFDFAHVSLQPGTRKAGIAAVAHDGIRYDAPKTLGGLFPNGIIPGAGLRPAILAVLKERGPSKATEVTKVLVDRKFPTDSAKTPLNTRVYNDLYRMAQLDQIKMENGLFSLKE